jgi:putative SOS response-associated peptidase YedK
MCGRFAQTISISTMLKKYKAKGAIEVKPNYNITPQSNISIVLNSRKSGEREVHLLRWGLIPHWSKELSIGNKLINARADTVGIKPSFRDSFKNRRCIIPADGFYEWQPDSKIPYFIKPKTGIFSFAGIWDRWADAEGKTLVTCAIITTDANKSLKNIHERVPVSLSDSEIDTWLNPETDKETLKSMLHAFNDDEIEFWQIDKRVSNPRNNDADLVKTI